MQSGLQPIKQVTRPLYTLASAHEAALASTVEYDASMLQVCKRMQLLQQSLRHQSHFYYDGQKRPTSLRKRSNEWQTLPTRNPQWSATAVTAEASKRRPTLLCFMCAPLQ